jgi:hypothetical protein
MRGKVGNVPHKRRYLGLAILALAVAAIAAMTTGAVSAPFASAATADTCGYSGGSTSLPVTNRSLVKFNEIGILEGISTTDGTSGNLSDGTVNVFYSDEHALTIGQTGTPWVATYNDPGTTIKRIDDAGTNPTGQENLALETPAGVATAITPGVLDTGAPATDPYGREVGPSLYLTDQGSNVNGTANSGDWQQQTGPNTTAQRAKYAGGTWKNNGAANPLGSDGKEAKNGADLGPHSETFVNNISTSQGIEGYGAEVRWDVSTLLSGGQPLKPGHTYRVQMMFHDGDHNADTGEACRNITIPPKTPTATTTADPQSQDIAEGGVDITDTAHVTGGTADGTGTLTFRLFRGGTATSCTGATLVDSQDVDVDAGLATGTDYSATFHVTLAGQYHFTVQFDNGGDISNSNFGPTACGAANENPVVNRPPPRPDTGQKVTVQDHVEITGFISGGGSSTVDFRLYDNLADCQAHFNTLDTTPPLTRLIFRALGVPIVQDTSGAFSASSGDFDVPTTTGNTTYYWWVHFNGNTNNAPADSNCTESFQINGNALPTGFDP